MEYQWNEQLWMKPDSVAGGSSCVALTGQEWSQLWVVMVVPAQGVWSVFRSPATAGKTPSQLGVFKGRMGEALIERLLKEPATWCREI
jgi:hypothetical protein